MDQDTVMKIEHKGTRLIFGAIWKAMDASSRGRSQMVAVDAPEIKGLVHKQVWWESLRELEEMGVIKRWRSTGAMWTTVMVNPFVVRPWWMKGKEFDDAMESFRRGPADLRG